MCVRERMNQGYIYDSAEYNTIYGGKNVLSTAEAGME